MILFYTLFLNDDDTAERVFGRKRCYHEERHDDAQTIKAVNLLGREVLQVKAIAKRLGDGLVAANGASRYYTINTTNENTIEFRKGRGSLNPDRIQAVVTFCESVCLFCRSVDFNGLNLPNFREWMRLNTPVTNALYHYYGIIDRDR